MSTSHVDHPNISPPHTQEVSDGVFAYIQPDGSWFLNNTGFLVGREGVISIDTTSTERRTKDYLTAVAQVTDRPIRTLVNTHHHGDHTHGNCLLPLATIIGHPLCREEIVKTSFPPLAGIWSAVEWGNLHPSPPFVTITPVRSADARAGPWTCCWAVSHRRHGGVSDVHAADCSAGQSSRTGAVGSCASNGPW